MQPKTQNPMGENVAKKWSQDFFTTSYNLNPIRSLLNGHMLIRSPLDGHMLIQSPFFELVTKNYHGCLMATKNGKGQQLQIWRVGDQKWNGP